MKIEVTKKTDATNAYEAFRSVRKGFLDRLNEPDLELTPNNWLDVCKCIESAEMGMRRNDPSELEGAL
jgi:hypothetical protein